MIAAVEARPAGRRWPDAFPRSPGRSSTAAVTALSSDLGDAGPLVLLGGFTAGHHVGIVRPTSRGAGDHLGAARPRQLGATVLGVLTRLPL